MLSSTHVHPSGDPATARYIIVGDSPDKSDVMKGRPFSSKQGDELISNLHAAGIVKSDCYFTLVFKDVDKPLNQYIKTDAKGMHISAAGQVHVNNLAAELASCTSKTIITLGNIPLFAITDRLSSYKWRGSVIDATLVSDKKVIPSVDPSSIIPHNDKVTGKWKMGQYTNKRLLIWDISRAKQVEEGIWKPMNINIKIRPTFTLSMQFLKVCLQYGLLGNPIAYDIEVDVFNGEMTCISFAYSEDDVISIPFTCEQGDYFTVDQEITILREIAKILEHPDIPIVGQNLCFDSHYMLRKYGIKVSNIHDTMVAQKILMPDYKVGLDFICSLYTNIPYYKDDGKYWLKGIGSFDSGWTYNALDSSVCAIAHHKQIRDLMNQGNYYTYLRKCRSIPPLVYLMEKGIRINVGSMQQAYDEMGHELDDTLAELHRVVGFPLNPNSPKQVGDYFYDTKKLPIYKSKTGGRSTDEKALKRIARKGYKAATIILKLRSLTKERSTYLDTAKVDKDGRMRCAYNPVGTRFSRVSSSENIFGTGNNLQNQPHKILTHFLADPFHVFYGMDLSQAENRLVAYVGKITQMIDAFEAKQDIHGLTARIMMQIYYGDKYDPEKSVKSLSPIGDGTKTWRDWGKKANHGLNYNQGYKNFSLQNEIPERDGATIVNIYHRAYPGVRNGYHAYVQRCINKDRTLTNMLGRKTFFADKLDDQLYDAAYACIPQGTVGDLIDQRGMNFVYYNTDPMFEHVQLLIQVHDQIGFQIPTPFHPTNPISWAGHSYILNEIKNSLETPIFTHYKKKIIIPVDTMMGVSLNKSEGVDLKNLTPDHLEKSYYEVTKPWLPMLTTA